MVFFCRMTVKSPTPIPSPTDKFVNYKQMMYAIRSHISLCICLEMIFKLPQKYINSFFVGHPLHESQFRTVNDGYFQSEQLHRYIPFVVHILYGKGGALITSAQQNSVWGILKQQSSLTQTLGPLPSCHQLLKTRLRVFTARYLHLLLLVDQQLFCDG